MNSINKIGYFPIIILTIILLFLGACLKDKTINPTTYEHGTVTDVENNVYKTVKIGNQWWMAENLRVTKYRNGNSIVNINGSDTAKWSSIKIGAFSYLDDNKNYNSLLYNWYAVADSVNVIAPLGWHIPTDNEWKVMEKYLSMSVADADNINFRGTTQATIMQEANGFSAFLGGCRMYSGIWGDPDGIKLIGFWWSSTTEGSNDAWYRHIDYKKTNVFRYFGSKNYGFSIRCVKD